MKFTQLAFIVVILLLLPSCKDFSICEDIFKEESVAEIEESSPQDGILNPNNPNELIYRWTDENVGFGRRYELRKRNLLTGEDKSLVKDVWYESSWSENGWVAFNRTDNQIWIMKDDGTELERLTSPEYGGAFYPSISGDGKMIAFSYRRDYHNIAIYDREIDTIKTILSGLWRISDPEFSPTGGKIAFIDGKYNKETSIVEAIDQLYIYDIKNDKKTRICEFPAENPVYTNCINWVSDNKIIVNSSEYTYLVDIENKSYKEIFEQKKKISLGSIERVPKSNGEKIILNVQRWKLKKFGKEKIEDRSIEIWKLDGMKKEEVLIP